MKWAYNQKEFIQEGYGARYDIPALFKSDALFNPIRNKPEFQQIIRDTEAKCQAKYERVRYLLEENNML